MADKSVLLPAAVLVLWSLIVLMVMFVQRSKIMSANKITLDKAPIGARGPDLMKLAPDARDWAAHNYVHLMEQPTIFYAAVVIIALGGATGYDVALAWLYVAVRIVHSIWQVKFNAVGIRATLFTVSSVVLLLLAIRAVLAVLA